MRKESTIMSRMKLMFAVLVLAASVAMVPQAQAVVTIEVNIAGSSAMWQTLALGAYSLAGAGSGHWTSASNTVNLTDTRVTPVNVDPGTTWIVWNSTATKVWAFTKVDSVVGDRCYFAQPHCTVSSSSLTGTGANQISSALWGDGSSDKALPASIVSIFQNGTPVTVAATDIRPEDGAFAACRVNSQIGGGTKGGGSSDNTDGLGYNSNNASGVCPGSGLAQANYVGSPIKSGFPGAAATDAANVLSFNISGSDPISGTAIPVSTVVPVGAAPVVFVAERASALKNLTNASDVQLQQAFSGTNCDASALGQPAGGINIFLREPLSGTMNTTEATVFRKPTVYPGSIIGISQEANVNAPVNNPLAAQSGTCLAGLGGRWRAIGTGEEVKSVSVSSTTFPSTSNPNGFDGIGYAFFSYGNVGSIANKTNFGYIQLDGIDPIFASYAGGPDPGQPAAGNGTLPAAANLPASCGSAFPCPESKIWFFGQSFPNVRNGLYRSWSLLRLVSNGTGATNAKALVAKSQTFVVNSVPDYIPFAAVKQGTTTLDPGLLIVRSHYQQYDGAGTLIGAAPVNKTDVGGDMGGDILVCPTATTCPTTTQSVNGNGYAAATRP
jgi:hypothetical protein